MSHEKRRPEGRRSENAAAKLPLTAQSTGSGDRSAPVTLAELGKLLRDEGTARAAGNADRWWWSCATTGLLHLASVGTEFTADALPALGIPAPDHPNRVGALFIAASKAGVIRPVGFTTSARRSRHAGTQRVWVGSEAA